MVEAVVYVFGALLLYVAYRAVRGGGEEADPENNPRSRSLATPR
jgi:threonine/homoserine/homoserine lactone efflux protein